MTVDHDFEPHRAALTGHCYRMLGSVTEAEDAVQETMVRAWRGIAGFEERSSLRTWLYRIATRVCLDALRERSRRERPVDLRPAGSTTEPLAVLPGEAWIEPISDAMAIPAGDNPHETLVLRESIRLAFIAALQHLPPRQRAALILTEVLGWSASEVAEGLETSVAAVNSALQRARAALASRDLPPSASKLSTDESQLLDLYVDAFQRYDVDALIGLLHHDAQFSMPPYTLWLQGREPVREWLLGPGAPCRGSRLIPVKANGSEAFAQYRPKPEGSGHYAWGLILLEQSGKGISSWTTFLDTKTIFPRMGLPLELD